MPEAYTKGSEVIVIFYWFQIQYIQKGKEKIWETVFRGGVGLILFHSIL